MPAKPYTEQVRKCEGTCGRLTRNTKMSKADYPDTVTRVTGTHCTSCHRALLREQGAPEPVRDAAADARKEQLAAERLAAAHRAAESIARQRQARQQRNMVRLPSMGQSMVRI